MFNYDRCGYYNPSLYTHHNSRNSQISHGHSDAKLHVDCLSIPSCSIMFKEADILMILFILTSSLYIVSMVATGTLRNGFTRPFTFSLSPLGKAPCVASWSSR